MDRPNNYLRKLSRRSFVKTGLIFVPSAIIAKLNSQVVLPGAIMRTIADAGGSSLAVGNRANSGACILTTPADIAFTISATSPVFVGVAWQGAPTVTSVNWKPTGTPEPFSLLANKVDGAGQNKLSLFVLANPTTGTDTIRVVFSANPGSGTFCSAIGTTGGNTSTPNRTVQTRNDANGTGPGLTDANFVAGDIEINFSAVVATTITFDADETTTTTEQDNFCSSGSSVGMSTKLINGTVGCTDAAFYSQIACAIIPA